MVNIVILMFAIQAYMVDARNYKRWVMSSFKYEQNKKGIYGQNAFSACADYHKDKRKQAYKNYKITPPKSCSVHNPSIH